MNEPKSILKIDTAQRSVTLDGLRMENVLGISVDWQGGKMPILKFETDSHVILEGTLLWRKVDNIVCPSCGYELGEFAGNYHVLCPRCQSECERFNI